MKRRVAAFLKRVASGFLSVGMAASVLLADFPVTAFAQVALEDVAEDETLLDEVSVTEGTGNLTSDYILRYISAQMEEQVAALNTEIFNEIIGEDTETEVTVSLLSSGLSSSSNDVSEERISDIEDAEPIAAAAEYDENGLAPTYHYLTLNYTLVEEEQTWEGMTITDIWDEVPEAFIASYQTTLNLYTLKDNEDYLVTLVDPAAINGLGSAIYADFTDGDPETPTVYNDSIIFDDDTGLIYVPKSFFFDESGKEVLRALQAQVLVPYSFENDTAIVTVNVTSEIEEVTGISGEVSMPALDVTITLQIVTEADAGKITIEDLYVTINNEALAFDLTDGGAYYDNSTGELTLAVAGNTVYAVDVIIKESAEDEAAVDYAEKEILLCAAGDISGFIALDTYYTGSISYATSVEDMKTLPGVSVEVENVSRGQTFSYSGAYAYISNYTTGSTSSVNASIITNTAPYSYYYQSSTGSSTAVDGTNMGNINADGSISFNAPNGLFNSASPDSNYNRVAALPNNQTLTSGSASITWSADITGNPSGYGQYVALHCVAATTGGTTVTSGTGTLIVRILYRKAATATSDGYIVFSLTSPTNYTQAGCAVYKVKEEMQETDYYIRFGVNKVSSEDSSTRLAAYFAYRVTTTDPAYNKSGELSLSTSLAPRARYAQSLYQSYVDGTLGTTSVTAMLGIYFDGSFTTSTSSVSQISLDSESCSSLASCDGNPVYVTLAEIIPAEGYIRCGGIWVLKITPSSESYSKSTLESVTYYAYDETTRNLSDGVSVSKTSYYFTLTNTPEQYYAQVGFDKYPYSKSGSGASRISGATIGLTTSAESARSGALNGGEEYAENSLKTSADGAVYSPVYTLPSGSATMTLYAYEALAPSGYVRNNGYWEINLRGTTDTTASGTQIISIVYYSYSESSGWMGYTLESTEQYDNLMGWYTSGESAGVLHITDIHASYVRIGLIKTDSVTGAQVGGATYVLSESQETAKQGADGIYTGSGTSTVTTTANGTSWFPVQNIGADITATYYVFEKTAPEGYERNTGYWEITLSGVESEDGIGTKITALRYFSSSTDTTGTEISASSKKTDIGGYIIEGTTDIFAAPNMPVKLYGMFSVRKVDDGGEALEGVVFGVYTDAYCENKIAEITTGDDGIASFTVPGSWYQTDGETKTYYVKELSVGDTYVLSENVYAVSIMGSKENAKSCMVSVYNVTEGFAVATSENAYTFSVTNESIKVDFYKRDIESSEEIEGAELAVIQVVDEEETVIDSWTSEKTAHRLSLAPGEYILREISAPTDQGYVKAEDITFTVGETGEVQSVTMYDDHTKLIISKIDYTDGSDVYGATLQLIDENGNVYAEWITGDTSNENIITDDDGRTYMALEYIPVGTYTLREVVTPDGYTTAEDITVVVEETGEVQSVIMYDDHTKLLISKIDYTDGSDVYGATLQLIDENGNVYAEWVTGDTSNENIITDDEGKTYMVLEYIPVGTYTLREVVTPDGYTTAEDMTVVVEETGEVQSVTMYDDHTKLLISKIDYTDGSDVYGATLQLIDENGDVYAEWVTGDTSNENIITDEDGKAYMVLEYIPVGTYTLREVVTPDGYTTAEDMTVVVEEIGSQVGVQTVEMIEYRTPKMSSVAKDAQTQTNVMSFRKEAVLVDTVSYNYLLPEKTYTITGVVMVKETGEPLINSDGKIVMATQTFTPSTKLGGTITQSFTIDTTVLSGQTLVVFETISEDGITIVSHEDLEDENQTVTVPKSGKIAVLKKGNVVTGITETVTELGTVGELTFDFTYLAGVEFTIYSDAKCTEEVMRITTDSAGIAVSENLVEGTYYILETYTPAGYASDDTVYEVVIDGIYESMEGVDYLLDVTKDIVNHLCSLTINIYKAGMDYTENKTVIPLEGVYFGIYADEDIKNTLGEVVIEKDTCIAIISTDTEGVATLTEYLPSGKYYYKELKTLDNFVLDETEYRFEVSLENDDLLIEINKDDPVINYPKYGTLTIHKVDQDDNPLGAGVEFLLTCEQSTESWTLVTGDDGTVSVEELPIGYINDGEWEYYTYTLRETKTLENYRLDETVYTFSFTAENTDADAFYRSFTVRNVILGVTDYSMAGGVSLMLIALVVTIAMLKRKRVATVATPNRKRATAIIPSKIDRLM